jgi:hypothetical protein
MFVRRLISALDPLDWRLWRTTQGDTVSDLDEFKSYYALSDQLIKAMTPEHLADRY